MTVFNGRRAVHDARIHNPVYRRETPKYPSAPERVFDPRVQSPRPRQYYTGSYVKGIATMHKSNAVPVVEGIGTNPKITT